MHWKDLQKLKQIPVQSDNTNYSFNAQHKIRIVSPKKYRCNHNGELRQQLQEKYMLGSSMRLRKRQKKAVSLHYREKSHNDAQKTMRNPENIPDGMIQSQQQQQINLGFRAMSMCKQIQKYPNSRIQPQEFSFIQNISDAVKEIKKEEFQALYVIGKGGFGKVWKVQCKKNRIICYAMKQMHKSKIINKKSVNSVMNERNFLANLKHDFIVNMSYAFQDRENLYLCMDYLSGGDLRYHIGTYRKFTQNQTKFIISNLIIALQYLHSNNIIHRDIKPENIVLDESGYIRITDLGISREYSGNNHLETSGTPGYMAPEVMCRRNHGFSVDFFAIGVIAFQIMMGHRPYLGYTRKEIRDQILQKQAMIKLYQIPVNWSIQSADFINKLLIRNPNNRLGSQGIYQLKAHPWLQEVNWNKLKNKEIASPYKPISIQQNYERYKQQISQDTQDENEQQTKLMLRKEEVQKLFEGYYYDGKKSLKKVDIKKNLITFTI